MKEFNRDEYISECYAAPAHSVRTPRKHAELIKAWADGAEIQSLHIVGDDWVDTKNPAWGSNDFKFRIKPELKPDVVEDAYVMKLISGEVYVCQGVHEIPNARFVWDGETGELKDAEVLK